MDPQELTPALAELEAALWAGLLHAEAEAAAQDAREAERRRELVELCGGEERLREMEALIARPEPTEEEYAASVADLQPAPGTDVLELTFTPRTITARRTTRDAIAQSQRRLVATALASTVRPMAQGRAPRSRRVVRRSGTRRGPPSGDSDPSDESEPHRVAAPLAWWAAA